MLVGLGTLAAGGGMGAINGVLVARLGLPSIVVTLATLVIGRESLRYVREGEFVRNLPPGFQWFGAGQAAGQWLVVAIALVVFAAFAWGLRHLAAGRAVYATGSDPEAARLAGIRPARRRFRGLRRHGGAGRTGGLAQRRPLFRRRPQRRNGSGAPGHRRRGRGRRGRLRRPGHPGWQLDRRRLAGLDRPGPGLPRHQPARRLEWFGKPQWEKAIQGLIILLAVPSDRV